MHGYARIQRVELGAHAPPRRWRSRTISPSPCRRLIGFHLAFHVAIGAQLEMELEVRNTAAAEHTFEEALHTYFAVATSTRYRSTAWKAPSISIRPIASQRKRRPASPIRIASYTDQVHVNTTAPA